MWLGDFPEDFTTVTCMFTTHQATGAPVAPNSALEAADVVIFKNGNATEKTTTNGVTMTSPFNGTTGLHCVTIDTSNDTGDSGFWTAASVYTLVLVPDETVDSIAVAKVIGQFGLALVAPLSAAGTRTAVGLASANLDTQIGTLATAANLATLAGYVDTEVAAIKAKTDNLPSDPADASDIAGSFSTVNGTLSTIAGYLDTEIAAIKAKTDNLPSDPADASDIAGAFGTINGKLDTIDGIVDAILVDTGTDIPATLATIDGKVDVIDNLIDTEIGALTTAVAAVDTVVDAIKVTTDKVDDTLEDDGGTFRFTANALEEAPTGGGGGPTASAIADEVQTRTIAAVTVVNGLAANSVSAAALATDAVTEIQSGLATAVNLATLAGYVDTEVAAIKAKTDNLPSDPADASDIATLIGNVSSTLVTTNSNLIAVKAKTDNLPSDPADQSAVAALISAVETKVDTVDTVVDAIKLKTDNLPASPAAVGSAMTLTGAYDAAKTAATQASVDDVPTSAELNTALGTADDAVLTVVNAVKTKTDQLTFTKSNELDINIQSVNDVTVIGTGAAGNRWRPE